MAQKKKFIKGAIKHPGAFTAAARRRGMTPAELQQKVLANTDKFSARLVKEANLRKTLVKLGHRRKGRK